MKRHFVFVAVVRNDLQKVQVCDTLTDAKNAITQYFMSNHESLPYVDREFGEEESTRLLNWDPTITSHKAQYDLPISQWYHDGISMLICKGKLSVWMVIS